MGLLDAVAGAISGAAGGNAGGGNALMNIAMQLISNPNSGGLQGLVKSFQEGGLKEQVASWVGTGANLPISGDQIKSVLGGKLGPIASQLGLSEGDAATNLANLLPGVVDKLTPNGQIPDGDLMAQGMNLLKGKLFG